ncbi:MAG TPA: glycosyltransferase family 2 protein [Candidatus Brocadiia bacterium]|nr:glycosyltransferase family 2 protein [Candidatus Brocadiia bacterium]
MSDSSATESRSAPEISVVIPCLNEERTVAVCVRKALAAFKAADAEGEVIVVDNGSSDGSAKAAREAGARVADETRKGYGSALLRGFREARGRFILMADADDSYDLSELPRFLEKLREGHDLVMGTRLKGDIHPGAMPAMNRYLGNPTLSLLIRVMHKSTVSDSQCGMRAFKSELPERLMLCSTGMEMASEIVLKAGRAGLKTAEIPISLHKTVAGRSPKLRPWRDGWRHLRLILMFAPGWLFALPGFFFLFLAIGLCFLGGEGWLSVPSIASLAVGLQLLSYYKFARIYLRDRMGVSEPDDASPPGNNLIESGVRAGIIAVLSGANALFLIAVMFCNRARTLGDAHLAGLALLVLVSFLSGAFFSFMLTYRERQNQS